MECNILNDTLENINKLLILSLIIVYYLTYCCQT